MSTIILSNSKKNSTPRADVTASRFSALMGSLWQGLETVGRRRAARHLIELSRVYEVTQPTLADEMKAAAEAALRG